MRIYLGRDTQAKCWLAMFDGHASLPNGEWLPLPFTLDAPFTIVESDMRQRHPQALIAAV